MSSWRGEGEQLASGRGESHENKDGRTCFLVSDWLQFGLRAQQKKTQEESAIRITTISKCFPEGFVSSVLNSLSFSSSYKQSSIQPTTFFAPQKFLFIVTRSLIQAALCYICSLLKLLFIHSKSATPLRSMTITDVTSLSHSVHTLYSRFSRIVQ